MNHESRLRPVDLARLSGLSTQQIRNYEDAGVLPPAARTESGYRVFGDVHRRALLTYRALQPGYGPLAATAVMRTLHDGDVPGALALVDAAHAGLHEQRTALRATREALEALATGRTRRRRPVRPTSACGSVSWPHCSAYGRPRYGCGKRRDCSPRPANAARATGSSAPTTSATPA